jgi:hypothetical protein
MDMKFGIDANVKIELFGKNGQLKTSREIHNTVTSEGLAGIADQILASPSLGVITHMELGQGTGGTTKLNSYVAGSRVAFDSKTRDGAVITVEAEFAAGVGTGTITEAGTFDSATEDSGNMWMYASFSSINKTADDSLVITWTLTAATS